MYTRNLSGYNQGSSVIVLSTQCLQSIYFVYKCHETHNSNDPHCTAVKVLTQQKSVYWWRILKELKCKMLT